MSACAVIGVSLSVDGTAWAWTFPEHVRIGQSSVEQTRRARPTSHAQLKALWDHAFAAKEKAAQGSYRLCDLIEKDSTSCVGIGSLVALAADHSCHPRDLRDNLPKSWISDVLRDGRELGDDLKRAGVDIGAREDVRRHTHVLLQSDDEKYLSRARVNNAHFQLAREYRPVDLHAPTLDEYLAFATRPEQRSNATALYAAYHVAALAIAKRARTECAQASGEACSRAALDAFLTESFALHFLEDSFSAGHFVGTWGDEDYRLGTHDHYSTHGVDARTWDGHEYGAYGDAFLAPTDEVMTSRAVGASLQQLAAAFGGSLPAAVDSALSDDLATLGQFDSCEGEHVPAGTDRITAAGGPFRSALTEVLQFEPIPSARSPETPRFRGEKGLFFGPSVVLEGGYAWQDRGVGARRDPGGTSLRARAGVRLGLGLGGIATNDMEDQLFAELGFASERYDGQPESSPRSFIGFYGRMRAPFVFFPILEPLFVAPFAYAKTNFGLSALTWASSGGVWGWQRTHAFGASGRWSWQISLLRDLSFIWFHNEPLAGYSRYVFTTSAVTVRHRFPFAGADWAVSSDLIFDLGAQVGWRDEIGDERSRPFVGPNLTVSMGAKVFP